MTSEVLALRVPLLVLFWASTALTGDLAHWNVEDVRAGMNGYGLTVVEGVEPARFNVSILGVLRNVEPGRDMVIARFSGLGLEKSGVMAGMSGSPVYIEDKLLGAVAYTWEFGLEPIGGITLYAQMREYGDDQQADVKERVDDKAVNANLPLAARLTEGGRWIPIATPVACSGMSKAALDVLARELSPRGLLPVQGGGANIEIQSRHAAANLAPGSAVAVGLVTGDVSVTAVGTVTVNQDGRIHAFGHPFVGLGRCRLPMLSAYIHTVMPLQSASFKIGSPLDSVGVFDADVSTTLAGQLREEATMIPVVIRASRDNGGAKEYHCQLAPVPQLMGTLLSTSVASCLEVHGMPPQELSTFVKAIVRIKNQPPLLLEDTFSGERYQGTPGLVQALSPLGGLVTALASNPFESIEIEAIECTAVVSDTRRSAALTHAFLDRREYLAGESAIVVVELRPFRSSRNGSDRVEVRLELALPETMAPGEYSIALSDGRTDAEKEGRARLSRCRDFAHWREVMGEQLRGRQTEIVARLATRQLDVAIEGVEFPDLPAALADVFTADRTRDVQRSANSLSVRHDTDWVIEGSKTLSFQVVERRKSPIPPSQKEPAP